MQTAPGLALTIAAVSLVFAMAMLGQMVLLIRRRRKLERRAASAQARDIALSRELLAIVSGKLSLADARMVAKASGEAQLGAFVRLAQMLRGSDRERLLELAERAGILASALSGLTHRDASRRVEAMQVLEQFPTDASAVHLRERMAGDPDPAARMAAAVVLARVGQLPRPAEVIAMLGLRSNPITPMHGMLFRSLAAWHAGDLASLATEPGLARLRPLIVEALGWSGDFAMLEPLAVHAKDAEAAVRGAALKAACRLEHPGAGRLALPLLADPSIEVRLLAIQTCAKLGVRDAIPALDLFRSSQSWWLRTHASRALAVLAPGAGAPSP